MASADNGGGEGQAVAGAAKRCVVCGIDCAGKPRVKDPNGRYYCKACHDVESARRTTRAPQASSDFQPTDDLAGLASLAAAAPVAALPVMGCCARCGSLLADGVVVCMGCGFDGRSRRATSTRGQRSTNQTKGGAANWLSYATDPGAWIQWVARQPAVLAVASLAAFVIAAALLLSEALLKSTTFTHATTGGVYLPETLRWIVIGATVPVTVLYWVVGPWFFRYRLNISGGECDPALARIAYFSTVLPAMVWAVPMTLIAYSSSQGPSDPSTVSLVQAITLVSLALLSVGSIHLWIMSWKGFGAKPAPSFLLIAALPIGVYVVWIIVALTASALTSALPAQTRSDSSTNSFRTPTRESRGPVQGGQVQGSAPSLEFSWLSFEGSSDAPYEYEYPASWRFQQHDAEGRAFAPVATLGPQGEQFMVMGLGMRENSLPISQSLDEGAARFQRGGLPFVRAGAPDMHKLGRWNGRGREYKVNMGGRTFTATLFIIAANEQTGVEHGRIMILLVVPDASAASRSTLDRILESLRLK